MNSEIKIPKSWDDVKVKSYLRYIDFVSDMKADLEEANKLKEMGDIVGSNEIFLEYLPFKVSIKSLSILGEIPMDELDMLTMDELDKFTKDIAFILEPNKIKKNKKPMELVLRDEMGREYMFIPFDERSVKEAKQMEAFDYLYPDDSVMRIGWKFSVVLRGFERVKDNLTGKEKIKWEPYDFDKCEYYKDIILDGKVGDIMGLNDFFLNIHQGLLTPTPKSSQSKKSQKEYKV